LHRVLAHVAGAADASSTDETTSATTNDPSKAPTRISERMGESSLW
jgi:hypothetical protein